METGKINKARIIATIGTILIIIGLGVQLIQYQNKLDELNQQLETARIKVIQLEEENDYLWSNYYMNVSDYNGEYEYYE